MKRIAALLICVAMTTLCGCNNINKSMVIKENKANKEISKSIDNMVLVEGGDFKNTSSRYHDLKDVSDFYIGKYEVTQKEWTEIMDNNPSTFKGDDLPVEMVSWYDSVEYCNKRSEAEGLKPYYNIDKDKKDAKNNCDYDDVKWTVSINEDADGYRLPTETEWEYAAEGGKSTQNFEYSGSNDIEEVAWYWKNSGNKALTGDWNYTLIENNNNKTKDIKSKKANELGLYDMSGNAREWCFDWYKDAENPINFYRVWKGGGIIGDGKACKNTYRGKFEANGAGCDQGFRLCKNA